MNNKWGFINEQGTLIIPCKYDWIADKQNNTNILLSMLRVWLLQDNMEYFLIEERKFSTIFNRRNREKRKDFLGLIGLLPKMLPQLYVCLVL